MKTLLTCSFALAALSGSAQHLTPTLPPAALTHADSAELIHQAFRHFRHREHRTTALVSAAALAQVGGMLSSSSGSSPLRTTLNITSGAVYTALLADYIVSLTKLSKRREAAALERFELHQAQPLQVQRMLVAYSLRRAKL